jgi:hypothetical protein
MTSSLSLVSIDSAAAHRRGSIVKTWCAEHYYPIPEERVVVGFPRAPERKVPHVKRLARRALVVCGFSSLLVPALAYADVYIWTDERGTTVISDTPPANPKRATNVEVVVKDSERKGAKPRTGARETTPTEERLLERIDNLERQLRAQTYTPPPQPAPAYSGTYYTSPPPPPPYDPYYSPYSAYPSYYPPAYPYVVYSTPFVRRSFAVGRPFPHRGFVHRGRR